MSSLFKRISAQVHVLQRLLSLCNEYPDQSGFTIDVIIKWAIFKKRNTPRESIRKALDRFIRLGIIFSPGSDGAGDKLYRIKRPDWAMDYIAGTPNKPWTPVTPTPPDEFADYDEHRPHFDIKLTTDWFEKIKKSADEKNGQLTLRTKSFVLSVNEKSLRGQIFVKPYWREDVKRRIGDDFYEYLQTLESKGAMRGDFCLPIDVKGQRFFLGGRPTQFSASHYPAQLDVRASKGDQHIRDGLAALTNQADFNTRSLDFQDAVLEALEKQGQAQTKIAENLQKLVKQFFPETDPNYQPGPDNKEGYG